MRQPRALVGERRAAMGTPPALRRRALRSAPPPRRPARALWAAIHYGVFGLKLAAGLLAGIVLASAIMNHEGRQRSAPAFETSRNETVVHRQARRPTYSQVELTDAPPEQALADRSDEAAPYYPREVRTVSFANPNPPEGIRYIVEVTRALASQALVKVGGFVTFAKETAEPQAAERPTFARKRTSVMDEVDDYLWEVYQRLPVKKDGTGDFTWKDEVAAKKAGMSLPDYVIGGMDPEFREQLYHAGRAMDAAGLQWSILSAFRDDYRQRLASGFKARVGYSLHGGSRRTGGYGRGRAIDITIADGEMWDVWRWIDAHGAKYGLYRPMPKADPAHVQPRGDWNKIAHTLRSERTKLAAKETTKTKVAAARISR